MTPIKSDPFQIQTTWRLSKQAGRKFLAGHPWVYSNEILHGPQGIEPGGLVQLQDAQGHFLAYGYGNPHSLIAFRTLSRDLHQPPSPELLQIRLRQAFDFRNLNLASEMSARVVYGEVDELPGLIIDRYVIDLEGSLGTVFVVQAHTAGMDRLLSTLLEFLPSHVGLIVRNDLSGRVLEKLEKKETQVLRFPQSFNPEQVWIRVQSASGHKEGYFFCVDLVHGQKTGFFLDQAANVGLSIRNLGSRFQGPVRFLDLCSYVGQWSVQWADFLQSSRIPFSGVLVDASEKALALAQKNLERLGCASSFEFQRGDVLKDLSSFSDRTFDLVICDPPAFIRGRKDLVPGVRAYLQLATQVFRLVKDRGGVVCCSCSGLLSEELFLDNLRRAAHRHQRQVKWVGRGSLSPDHPVSLDFPEGHYLKAWMGCVER